MAEKTSNLTPKQEKAISCLLTEPSITKAAKAAGVGERTLYRWLEEADFAAAYQSARRDAVGQAIGRLQQASSSAVTVLMALMLDKPIPASTRFAAARSIIELSLRAVELEDIEARLAALEATMKERH